jgi:hypothetical protein
MMFWLIVMAKFNFPCANDIQKKSISLGTN